MAKGGRHTYGSGPPDGWTGKTTTLERGVPEIRLNRTEKNNKLTPAMYGARADAILDGDRGPASIPTRTWIGWARERRRCFEVPCGRCAAGFRR